MSLPVEVRTRLTGSASSSTSLLALATAVPVEARGRCTRCAAVLDPRDAHGLVASAGGFGRGSVSNATASRWECANIRTSRRWYPPAGGSAARTRPCPASDLSGSGSPHRFQAPVARWAPAALPAAWARRRQLSDFGAHKVALGVPVVAQPTWSSAGAKTIWRQDRAVKQDHKAPHQQDWACQAAAVVPLTAIFCQWAF